MKIKTQYNKDQFSRDGEKNNKPSVTIPDQSMTVKEIMSRFARGLSVTGNKVPVYNGEDDDMPDLSRLDLVERQEVLEQVEQEVKDIKARINETQAKKKAKFKEQEIEFEVEKRLKNKLKIAPGDKGQFRNDDQETNADA